MNKPAFCLKGALLGVGLLAVGAAQAATLADINFSEVSLLTVDPSIQGFQFSAGDAASFYATYTDDTAVLSGNPYLNNGFNDDGFSNPVSAGVPTGASLIVATPTGAVGGANNVTTISLDAEILFPSFGGSTLIMAALSGGVVQGFASFTSSSSIYNPLQIVLTDKAFDALYVYDPTEFNFFIIDNLKVDVTPTQQPPCTGVACPEPSSLLLLSLGVLGLGWTGRRSRQAA